jgi:hypothetical protein
MKEVKREKVSNFNFLFGHVDDMHARASCPANDTHTHKMAWIDIIDWSFCPAIKLLFGRFGFGFWDFSKIPAIHF